MGRIGTPLMEATQMSVNAYLRMGLDYYCDRCGYPFEDDSTVSPCCGAPVREMETGRLVEEVGR